MPTKIKNKYMQKGGTHPDYSMNSLLFVCFIGMIIRFFFSSPTSVDGASGPVTAAIWGYGLCAIALFFLMFLTYGLMNSKGNNLTKSAGEFIGTMLTTSGSILATLGVFMYIIWLYLTYSTKINTGRVADEFYEMSNISGVAIIFQLSVLTKSLVMIVNKDDGVSESRKKMVTNAIYLLTVVNVIFIAIMNIILAYFSTDG